jgi:hypothetical protein
MRISKLALVAALGLTAAAYPTGQPDDTGYDASMPLRPGGINSQGPREYNPVQSGSQRGQRGPKIHPSERDGPHPPQVNPSNGPGPHRVSISGSGGPSTTGGPTRLPPGAVPSNGQPRQYSKRHEGHDAEQPQGPPSRPPSGPSPKPGRTGPSYGDHSSMPERPDRDRSGHTEGDHHEHDHLHDHNKPGRNGEDKNDKNQDGRDGDGKDDNPGKDGKGYGDKPDRASPTSKLLHTGTSTLMPSRSAESTVLGGPTPSASLKPEGVAVRGH